MKTLNSATNPTRPGRPRDAMKEIIMNVAMRGARFAIPPSSEMFRVPILWPSEPATMNRAGHEAVGEHLEDRTREAEDRAAAAHREAVHPGGDAEGHESHVAHARERDEPFQVVLREAHDRPVQDRDDPGQSEEPVHVDRGLRDHLDVESNQSVAAELQEDPREDDGA